jgi:hypothetical protein
METPIEPISAQPNGLKTQRRPSLL